MVNEPTVEDTISILRGLKERYEVYHGVRIHDSALVAAATLSDRYITDRFLPDKAIDLVDEACASIRTEIDSMPSELDDVRRKIMQLEIEEMALKKETDKLSKERLEKLGAELAEYKDKFNEMKSRWEAENRASMRSRSSSRKSSRLTQILSRLNFTTNTKKRQSSNITICPLLKSVSQKPKRRASSAPKIPLSTTP